METYFKAEVIYLKNYLYRDLGDVVMNPKTRFQHLVSKFILFLEPYYAYFIFPHTMQCAKDAGNFYNIFS